MKQIKKQIINTVCCIRYKAVGTGCDNMDVTVATSTVYHIDVHVAGFRVRDERRRLESTACLSSLGGANRATAKNANVRHGK